MRGGEIDVVIFSPPFTNEPFADKKFVIRDRKSSGPSRYSDFGAGDIGGLPYGTLPDGGGLGVDAIITSPSYSDLFSASRQGKAIRAGTSKIHGEKQLPRSYSEELGRENISALPHGNADAIVTSPPYSEIFSKGHKSELGDEKSQGSSYKSESKANIGNLKEDTYLGAMLQVYRECYKVLKPGGVMVLITKNFIRNKKIVRLDLDTIKLCEAAGFKFAERWYRKLEHPSFWRIIYAKKFHYCPQCVKVYRVRKATSDKPSLTKCPKCQAKLKPALVEFEDILVFRKPEATMCPACGKHELVPHPSDTLLCPECGFTKTEAGK